MKSFIFTCYINLSTCHRIENRAKIHLEWMKSAIESNWNIWVSRSSTSSYRWRSGDEGKRMFHVFCHFTQCNMKSKSCGWDKHMCNTRKIALDNCMYRRCYLFCSQSHVTMQQIKTNAVKITQYCLKDGIIWHFVRFEKHQQSCSRCLSFDTKYKAMIPHLVASLGVFLCVIIGVVKYESYYPILIDTLAQ